jgi:RNA polymerase sigma-70 factor (ECF subfamily)
LPEESVKERQTRQLERALSRLTAEDRELITLKHLDGLSYGELAERLGIPSGTAMSRLYYARQRLRQEVENLLEEE